MSKGKRSAKKAAQDSSNIQAIAALIGLIAISLIGWFIWSAFSGQADQQPADEFTIPALQEAPIDIQPVLTDAPTVAAPEYKQYASSPELTIDPAKQYFATFKMAKGGEFTLQLFPDKAPITVNSFVFLAREGYYNGVTFHRVLAGFMAQGGDPTGTGSGGPGYEFVNEDNDLKFDKEGVVAMANAGRDTNGSQFFITFAPADYLNGGYTIFGQITEGIDVVNAITLRDPQTYPNYSGDAIESVTITEK